MIVMKRTSIRSWRSFLAQGVVKYNNHEIVNANAR